MIANQNLSDQETAKLAYILEMDGYTDDQLMELYMITEDYSPVIIEKYLDGHLTPGLRDVIIELLANMMVYELYQISLKNTKEELEKELREKNKHVEKRILDQYVLDWFNTFWR